MREQEQAEPGSRLDRSVHPNVQTHILAAIRLFTCQRAMRSREGATYILTPPSLRGSPTQGFLSGLPRRGEGDHSGRSHSVNRVARKFSEPTRPTFLVPFAVANRGRAR